MKTIYRITCFTIGLVVAWVTIVSCSKQDEYYLDGGLAAQSEAEKNLLLYDFLSLKNQDRGDFDSLLRIIDLTNSQALINQSGITFFAAKNLSIRHFQKSFPGFTEALDPPRTLANIPLDTLQLFLNMWVFPQTDIELQDSYQRSRQTVQNANGEAIFIDGLRGDFLRGLESQGEDGFVRGIGALYIQYVKLRANYPNLTADLRAEMQTHNLITRNARLHVLRSNVNFAGSYNFNPN
ncbi:hypothetical protein [Sphingobacterium bambusae]|uniref:FAS1 domain-containing protein n=1 Tax=Sphingobacterium bambusae TaxID=662858 RepID=A0ABW6BKV2_9SPHI|nr:hypothetical protein [Sphingobacterium bambusae]WPL50905.1 hypothetical protein SCB77_10640 [Sphingobacterium bambusae]